MYNVVYSEHIEILVDSEVTSSVAMVSIMMSYYMSHDKATEGYIKGEGIHCLRTIAKQRKFTPSNGLQYNNLIHSITIYNLEYIQVPLVLINVL